MKNLVDKIANLTNSYTVKKLDVEQLILTQRKLKLNNMPEIPMDYIKVLHQYNSLMCDGCCIFGVSPCDDNRLDLIIENALIQNPNRENCLILGWSELEFLQWHQQLKHYQIIDKYDFEVLKTYQTCELALMDFLRLGDD